MIRDTASDFLRQHGRPLAFIGIILAALFYTAGVQDNPPGFYIDESSISYNAYTISRTGRDEHGTPWPLFFRAFGDYKNPVYIYLLAALFKLTGPSILFARLLSGTAGLLAALMLGLLAARLSGRRVVGLLVAFHALLTPWLFETSRMVMEVAFYPLALSLFLLCLHRLSLKAKWSALDVTGLALTLALLTYTYSIGRLLAPLLAFGLVLFATRERWPGVLQTWCAYLVTLVPLFDFHRRHPGALLGRFKLISYINLEKDTYAELFLEFLKHYVGHLNLWRLLVAGEPNPDIFINGHLLVGTVIFALLGGYLVLAFDRRNAWWLFIHYGLVVSLIPASLTKEYFHLLRLIVLPVFLLVLSAPALAWMLERSKVHRAWRSVFTLLFAITLLQAIVFQWQFHRSARTPKRLHQFDAEYSQAILAPALAAPSRPIYLADVQGIPGYIQAYWHATLQGVDLSQFVLLPVAEPFPQNALVISTEENCYRCRIIAMSEPYTIYLADKAARRQSPLTDKEFRAEIYLPDSRVRLRVNEKETIRVRVKNLSETTWLVHERSAAPYQISLGNHWLDAQGQTVTGDDGRSVLSKDLRPGEEGEFALTINTPKRAGDYILEIDMVQEGVSWFAAKGSLPLRLRVRVE